MSCLLHASCLQYTYERTVLIWEWLLTIRKQDPRTTAFVVTSRSIGTKITDKTKAGNESCTRQNSQKDNKEGFQYPGYPIDGTQWPENQSINPNQSIKLVNWYRLVSVNRWSIDNNTKLVHWLASIGRGPRNICLRCYLTDHPPFLEALWTTSVFSAQRIKLINSKLILTARSRVIIPIHNHTNLCHWLVIDHQYQSNNWYRLVSIDIDIHRLSIPSIIDSIDWIPRVLKGKSDAYD